jgi:hypothetical protein
MEEGCRLNTIIYPSSCTRNEGVFMATLVTFFQKPQFSAELLADLRASGSVLPNEWRSEMEVIATSMAVVGSSEYNRLDREAMPPAHRRYANGDTMHREEARGMWNAMVNRLFKDAIPFVLLKDGKQGGLRFEYGYKGFFITMMDGNCLEVTKHNEDTLVDVADSIGNMLFRE